MTKTKNSMALADLYELIADAPFISQLLLEASYDLTPKLKVDLIDKFLFLSRQSHAREPIGFAAKVFFTRDHTSRSKTGDAKSASLIGQLPIPTELGLRTLPSGQL